MVAAATAGVDRANDCTTQQALQKEHVSLKCSLAVVLSGGHTGQIDLKFRLNRYSLFEEEENGREKQQGCCKGL